MPVSNDVANCSAMLDALYLCVTPAHQFSELHMFGSYRCVRVVKNKRNCCHKAAHLRSRRIALCIKVHYFDSH